MRKTFIAMLALVAAMMVSCEKESAVRDGKEIIFNFSVATLPGEGVPTRAVKSGWASGDKINIWFDENYEKTPDLVLTYDGSAWNAGDLRTGCELKASGTLSALFEGYNDLSKYGLSKYDGFLKFGLETKTETNEGASLINMVAYVNKLSYTFADNTLTSTIDGWFVMPQMQVVITGLPEGKAWWLNVQSNNNNSLALRVPRNIMLRPAYNTEVIAFDGFNVTYYVKAQDNADGKAFYFDKRYGETATQDLDLKLLDSEGKTYTYSVTGKTITPGKSATDPGTFQAVKIAFSKFTEVTE